MPPEWVVRRQTDDYGVDYEVEVFAEGQSTGVVFKVQLKGRSSVKLVSKGRAAVVRVKTWHLEYWLDRVPCLVCSPKTGPGVMRVLSGIEAGKDCHEAQTSNPGADHRAVA